MLDPSNNVLRASPGAARDRARAQPARSCTPNCSSSSTTVRRSGEPIVGEVTVARGPFGDSTLRLRVRVARLGTRFVLLLAEDRTESYRLDEVRRDFVANISHELKTPIASVSLLAEALDQAADEPDQVRRFAGRLSVEAARLAHIIERGHRALPHPGRGALRTDVLLEVDEIVAAAVEQNRVVAAAKRRRRRRAGVVEGRGLRRPSRC